MLTSREGSDGKGGRGGIFVKRICEGHHALCSSSVFCPCSRSTRGPTEREHLDLGDFFVGKTPPKGAVLAEEQLTANCGLCAGSCLSPTRAALVRWLGSGHLPDDI